LVSCLWESGGRQEEGRGRWIPTSQNCLLRRRGSRPAQHTPKLPIVLEAYTKNAHAWQQAAPNPDSRLIPERERTRKERERGGGGSLSGRQMYFQAGRRNYVGDLQRLLGPLQGPDGAPGLV
ncbi:unnamed protein product, partial [Pylaiella littoralis]